MTDFRGLKSNQPAPLLNLVVSRLKLLGVRTPMKLSAYIITVDSGFAPNPFGRYCTLACCKPTIRRMAEKDDIVIACASSRCEARPPCLCDETARRRSSFPGVQGRLVVVAHPLPQKSEHKEPS